MSDTIRTEIKLEKELLEKELAKITPDVAGFTIDGKVYLNVDKISSVAKEYKLPYELVEREVAQHEMAHVAVKSANKKLASLTDDAGEFAADLVAKEAFPDFGKLRTAEIKDFISGGRPLGFTSKDVAYYYLEAKYVLNDPILTLQVNQIKYSCCQPKVIDNYINIILQETYEVHGGRFL
jgi:hypothetical protein